MNKIRKTVALLWTLAFFSAHAGFAQSVKNDTKMGGEFRVLLNTGLTLYNPTTQAKHFTYNQIPGIFYTAEWIYTNNLVYEVKAGLFQGNHRITDNGIETLFFETNGFSGQAGMKFYFGNFYKRGFVPYGGINIAFYSFTNKVTSLDPTWEGRSAGTSVSSLFLNWGMDYQFKQSTFRFGVSVNPFSAITDPVDINAGYQIWNDLGPATIVLGVTSFYI